MKRQFDENMLDDLLKNSRLKAHEDTARRVMARLPESVPSPFITRVIQFWPADRWAMPAFAGAAAAIIITCIVLILSGKLFSDEVRVTFTLEAPDASKIELVGTFNNWEPGNVELKGPDKKGRWSASVQLKEGRHEYMFLVDGQTWMTDPSATVYRPDGFGRENAIIDI